MSVFKHIGIIGKRSPQVAPTLERLCGLLRAAGRVPLIEAGCASLVDAPGAKFLARSEMAQRCDLIIVAGGDGTLLSAARDFAPAGVPLLGINQGRLGFMVDVHPDDMAAQLGRILAGDHVHEERLMLSASIERGGRRLGPFPAINEVVIRNQAAIRMLEFETWLGARFISQHRADGMIVSSPTGSTAYALSGGGPVLHPSLDALALVPICPHTLSDRPVVVGASEPVRIVLGGGEGTRAMFTCDGQTQETLDPGDAVEIARAPQPLRLIHPADYDYFSILRNKLHWGRAPA